MLDARFLPNPHWVAELRPFTGLDANVKDYVLGRAEAGMFLDQVVGSHPPAGSRLRERAEAPAGAGHRLHRRAAPVGGAG